MGCSDGADWGRKAGESLGASWGMVPVSELTAADESAGDSMD